MHGRRHRSVFGLSHLVRRVSSVMILCLITPLLITITPPPHITRATGFTPLAETTFFPSAHASIVPPAIVTLSDAGFAPAQVTITAGMDVTFSNSTAVPHTLIGVAVDPQTSQFVYLPLINNATTAGLSAAMIPASTTTSTNPCQFQAPLPAQGQYTHTFAQAGMCGFYLAATPTITGRVIVSAPTGSTTLSGRLLDTTDATQSVERPIVGAVVALLGTNRASISNQAGEFVISDIPTSAEYILDINPTNAQPAPDGAAYAGFREQIQLVPGLINAVTRPFYIPRLDMASLTPVNPNGPTTVTNPNLQISMTVAKSAARGEDGQPFTGKLSISEVPDGLAPAAMPDTLRPAQVITVQPVGVSFSTPVPIRFPNTDNLPAGTQTDLWSLNPTTGTFVVVGVGQVSSDGKQIQTISGGIRAADWHFVLPVALGGASAQASDIKASPQQQLCANSSLVSLNDGCLVTAFDLPRHTSLATDRGLSFVYRSERADPQQVIPVDATIPTRAALPKTIAFRGQLNNGAISTPQRYVATTGLSENQDETLRFAIPIDTSYLATGVYPFDAVVTSNYQTSSVSTIMSRSVMVVNGQTSPFGVGWDISDRQQIFPQPDGSVLLTQGQGTALRYTPSQFRYQDFTDRTRLTMNGDAVTINRAPVFFNEQNVLRLTNTSWQGSTVFQTDPIPLIAQNTANSFSTAFQFQITDVGGVGADGLAFVIAPTPTSLGQSAGYLGFTGVTPSLAVEFDTYSNGWDPSGNHVGLNLNGNITSDVTQPLPSTLENGQVWSVWIDYDGPTRQLAVRIAPTELRPTEPVLSTTVDLAGLFAQPNAFVGFSGGSGSAYETIDIRSWDFAVTSAGATSTSLTAPTGDYSTLSQTADGGFLRRMPNGTVAQFRADGRQTALIDRSGNTTTFAYDPTGLLTQIVEPPNQITTLNYLNGRLASVIDPANRTTIFQHDPGGNLTQVTFPDTTQQSFGYDPRHHMTRETDQRGGVTTREFNAVGQIIRATLPDGSVRQASASELWGLVGDSGTAANPSPPQKAALAQSSLTDGVGRITKATTGRFGELTSFTDSANLVTRITRDANGNPVLTTLPSGALIDTQFDGSGNLRSLTDRTLNGTTTLTYEPTFNQLQTITTPLGKTTTFTYDAQGNLLRMQSPLNRMQQFSYTPQSLVESITDPLGTTTTYTYNDQHNPVSIASGAGAEQRVMGMAYTSAGLIAQQTDPLGRVSGYSYDAVGRPIQIALPGNRTITMSYDQSGNLLALTPPGRAAHQFAYTPTGLVASINPPDIGLSNDTTSYTYNAAQQITAINRPDGQQIGFGYDPAGRLKTTTTPRGVTTVTYGATSGLLTGLAAPGNVNLTYSYNRSLPIGVSWSGPVAGSVGYTYDQQGRASAISVNAANPITLSYDDDSLLRQVGAWTLTRSPQSGLPSASTIGNIADSWSYNAFAEPTRYSATASGATAYDAQYSRDLLGRITQKIEIIGGVTTTSGYTYDQSGRLIEVRQNGLLVEQYSYDANGNRTSATVRGTPATGSYDGQDRLLSYGNAIFSYTPNGELLTRVQAGQTTSYTYDLLGNLTAVGLPDGRQISYLIDGQDRRVGKRVNGTLAQGFLYEDQLRPIAELNGSGTIVSRFIYGQKVNVPEYMTKGGVTYRLITDQLGSVRLVLNTVDGSNAQRIDYDAFGNVVQDTNPGFQPFGYAGGLYDRDTGLVRFGARDYDPAVGRWTTKDPIGFAGGDTNLYGYVGGGVINQIDPYGLLTGLFPGKGPDWHHNRNKYQQCPNRNPQPNSSCSKNSESPNWKYEGNSLTHGGYPTYRGIGPNKGSQCVYYTDNTPVTNPEFWGTYDYISPYYENGSSFSLLFGFSKPVGHFFVDVLPWLIFGN